MADIYFGLLENLFFINKNNESDIIFYFMLQNISHNIHYHYYFFPTCYKHHITLQDLSHNIHYDYYFFLTCYKRY